MSIVFKVVCSKTLTVVKFVTAEAVTFAELQATIAERFGIEDPASVRCLHVDSESDFVELASEGDLEAAKASLGETRNIKIFVEPKCAKGCCATDCGCAKECCKEKCCNGEDCGCCGDSCDKAKCETEGCEKEKGCGEECGKGQCCRQKSERKSNVGKRRKMVTHYNHAKFCPPDECKRPTCFASTQSCPCGLNCQCGPICGPARVAAARRANADHARLHNPSDALPTASADPAANAEQTASAVQPAPNPSDALPTASADHAANAEQTASAVQPAPNPSDALPTASADPAANAEQTASAVQPAPNPSDALPTASADPAANAEQTANADHARLHNPSDALPTASADPAANAEQTASAVQPAPNPSDALPTASADLAANAEQTANVVRAVDLSRVDVDPAAIVCKQKCKCGPCCKCEVKTACKCGTECTCGPDSDCCSKETCAKDCSCQKEQSPKEQCPCGPGCDCPMDCPCRSGGECEMSAMNIIGQLQLSDIKAPHPSLPPNLFYVQCSAHIFFQPTEESINRVVQFLLDPTFSNVFLYSSRSLDNATIIRLAQADVQTCVHTVECINVDPLLLDTRLFVTPLPSIPLPAGFGEPMEKKASFFNRFKKVEPVQPKKSALTAFISESSHTMSPLFKQASDWVEQDVQKLSAVGQSIASLAVQLNLNPHIRYQASSQPASLISKQLSLALQNSPARPHEKDSTILILDRRIDPISPLLLTWTYQAMIDQHIPLNTATVSVPHSGQSVKALLSPLIDPYFERMRFLTYPDAISENKKNVKALEAIKASKDTAMDLSELQKTSNLLMEQVNLTIYAPHHTSLLSHITSIRTEKQLFELGDLQQSLVCDKDYGRHFSQVSTALASLKWTMTDKTTLLFLLSLKYKKERAFDNDFKSLLSRLVYPGNDVKNLSAADISILNRFYSEGFRPFPLFKSKLHTKFNRLLSRRSAPLAAHSEASDLTRFVPKVLECLEDVIETTLDQTAFPFVDPSLTSGTQKKSVVGSSLLPASRTVFVFVVGGMTYFEYASIHQFQEELNSKRKPGEQLYQFYVGGTSIIHRGDIFGLCAENAFPID
ncbi:putative Vacuolar protein sorting-associated protein 45 [Blattamonas nauphoetae]|uniref:Vacuolar protein sorting-associated protein 45 n=1 Tax=Blattamonas nauphoetae TaxID=2049346 RepID=A0ABQ9XJF0_9EUKA|nr:putative Vacuolar protein sorting-associated protein 45 [Blattamonas nauphoetae]